MRTENKIDISAGFDSLTLNDTLRTLLENPNNPNRKINLSSPEVVGLNITLVVMSTAEDLISLSDLQIVNELIVIERRKAQSMDLMDLDRELYLGEKQIDAFLMGIKYGVRKSVEALEAQKLPK